MNFNFQTDILGDEQMLDSTRYITSKGNTIPMNLINGDSNVKQFFRIWLEQIEK